MRHFVYIIVIVLTGAAIAFSVLGLQGRISRKPPLELFPDMDRQAKLRPQEPNPFFTNGISSQLPPAGTIARSTPIQTGSGPVYGFEDAPVNTGFITGTTNFLAANPLTVTGKLVQRGHERYDIYCTPCHGKLGDGNGITKKLGVMPAVADLHATNFVYMTDGQIFNTITHGKGLMGAYGSTVPVEDRWAIVAYTRALQLSWLGSADDLTAEQKAALK